MNQTPATPDTPVHKLDVVLGAGGIKGFAHMGFWKALSERNISPGTVTGGSVGALCATFFTNGWEPDRLTDLFLKRVADRFNPLVLAKCFGSPDLLSFMLGGCTDLTVPLREMVKEFGLRPNGSLKIVTYDLMNRKPFIFQGEDYDLGLALAASCAMPGVLMPVKHIVDGRQALLVDGAMYHRNPTDFSTGPALVSRLGFATEPAQEWQIPLDLYFHLREMYYPILHQPFEVDETKHIVATTLAPEVAGLNFGISRARCLKLVDEGQAAALQSIDEALASGKMPAAV